MNSDLQTIQGLLNLVINEPDRVTTLSARELDLTLRLTRRARLLGRLGEDLRSAELLDSLPTIAADHLQAAITMADARARVALWELNRVEYALRSETAVPLIVMKGCAYLLLGLPNAAGRIFADVDLMTAEANLERVEELLSTEGWLTSKLTPYDQNYYRKWTHELPPMVHEEREVEIDLHHNITPRTARIHPSAAKLLGQSEPLPDSRLHVLSSPDIVLHAITHLMFDGDLADDLRGLVDVRDLIEHYLCQDADFWRPLLNRAAELEVTRPVYYAIRYLRMLLSMHVPDYAIEVSDRWAPPKLIVSLMDRLVPRAIYPQHPDNSSRVSGFCRLLLYVRSHWIRMPPWLLIYHLSYKFFATHIRTVQTS